MIEQGYERTIAGQHRSAVRWWYTEQRDGFTFARGGRCSTSREARHLIDAARLLAMLERTHEREFPTHTLLEDGGLRAIV